MSDPISLQNLRGPGTYKRMLQIPDAGVDATLKPVRDGEGQASALSLSTTAVNVTGPLTATSLTLTTNLPSSNVAFTQTGTGAVTRTAQDKLREPISVKDFGAADDGSTNSSTAFQNALNATRANNYETIVVPTGSYSVPTPPTIGVRNPLWMLSGSVGDVSTTLPGATFSSLKGPVVTVPNGAAGDGWRFEVIKDASPLNYAAGTRAAMIVQQRDTQTLAAQQTVPGAVFQFASTGAGVVDSAAELSQSIWWGLFASMTKTNDGSGHAFTGVCELGAVGAGGYNEAGLFQGEVTNTGSTKGTIAGGEVLLKDSADAGVTSYSTRIYGYAARLAKYNTTTRRADAFVGSCEGSQAIDSLLTTNQTVIKANNKWKYGVDLRGTTITTGAAIAFPNNTGLSWEDAAGALRPIMALSATDITFLRPGSAAATAYVALQSFAGGDRLYATNDASNGVWIFVGGVMKQVTQGAANSAGTGFRQLIVAN